MAERRWSANDPDGVLQFGVDVARMRDKLHHRPRRGNSIRELIGEKLGDDDYSRAVDMLFGGAGEIHSPARAKSAPRLRRKRQRRPRFGQELRARKADELFEIYPIYSTFRPKTANFTTKARRIGVSLCRMAQVWFHSDRLGTSRPKSRQRRQSASKYPTAPRATVGKYNASSRTTNCAPFLAAPRTNATLASLRCGMLTDRKCRAAEGRCRRSFAG